MLSRTAQYRIVQRGALLAAVIGSAWGCTQLAGPDLDKPFQTGGAGGSNATTTGTDGVGGTDATSATGAGGTAASSTGTSTSTSAGTSTSTSTSSSTSTSATSSSSSSGTPCMPQKEDTICGPDGNDVDCDGVVGNCLETQLVHVGMKVTDPSMCASMATDFRMSTIMTDIPVDFPLVAQFRTFKQLPPGTNVTEISTCVPGAGKHVVAFGTSTCTPTSPEYKFLGYVSTKAGMGYEQLAQISYQGITAAVPVSANGAGNQVCCHASCSAISFYVLQQ